MNSPYIIPSHLKETIRYKQYRWNRRGDLKAIAQEVVTGPHEKYAFLGLPLEPRTSPKLQKEKADSAAFI